MVKTNRDRLLEVSVIGDVNTATFAATPPGYLGTPYMVTPDGVPKLIPLPGGIVYNVRTGDPAVGWEADTLCPGVSLANSNPSASSALITLACIGNKATVMSGGASSEQGVVTGKYGNGPFVVVDFAPEILEKIAIGDKVQVRAVGTGLAIEGFEGVRLLNIDPDVLQELVAAKDGKLEVAVAVIVPAEVVGAGSGNSPERAETQIMMSDPESVQQLGLDKLRLGDVVGITDYDATSNMHIRRGATTVGIVGHGSSFMGGHGPGVTPFLATKNGALVEMVVKEGTNIAPLIGIK